MESVQLVAPPLDLVRCSPGDGHSVDPSPQADNVVCSSVGNERIVVESVSVVTEGIVGLPVLEERDVLVCEVLSAVIDSPKKGNRKPDSGTERQCQEDVVNADTMRDSADQSEHVQNDISYCIRKMTDGEIATEIENDLSECISATRDGEVAEETGTRSLVPREQKVETAADYGSGELLNVVEQDTLLLEVGALVNPIGEDAQDLFCETFLNDGEVSKDISNCFSTVRDREVAIEVAERSEATGEQKVDMAADSGTAEQLAVVEQGSLLHFDVCAQVNKIGEDAQGLFCETFLDDGQVRKDISDCFNITRDPEATDITKVLEAGVEQMMDMDADCCAAEQSNLNSEVGAQGSEIGAPEDLFCETLLEDVHVSEDLVTIKMNSCENAIVRVQEETQANGEDVREHLENPLGIRDPVLISNLVVIEASQEEVARDGEVSHSGNETMEDASPNEHIFVRAGQVVGSDGISLVDSLGVESAAESSADVFQADEIGDPAEMQNLVVVEGSQEDASRDGEVFLSGNESLKSAFADENKFIQAGEFMDVDNEGLVETAAPSEEVCPRDSQLNAAMEFADEVLPETEKPEHDKSSVAFGTIADMATFHAVADTVVGDTPKEIDDGSRKSSEITDEHNAIDDGNSNHDLDLISLQDGNSTNKGRSDAETRLQGKVEKEERVLLESADIVMLEVVDKDGMLTIEAPEILLTVEDEPGTILLQNNLKGTALQEVNVTTGEITTGTIVEEGVVEEETIIRTNADTGIVSTVEELAVTDTAVEEIVGKVMDEEASRSSIEGIFVGVGSIVETSGLKITEIDDTHFDAKSTDAERELLDCSGQDLVASLPSEEFAEVVAEVAGTTGDKLMALNDVEFEDQHPDVHFETTEHTEENATEMKTDSELRKEEQGPATIQELTAESPGVIGNTLAEADMSAMTGEDVAAGAKIVVKYDGHVGLDESEVVITALVNEGESEMEASKSILIDIGVQNVLEAEAEAVRLESDEVVAIDEMQASVELVRAEEEMSRAVVDNATVRAAESIKLEPLVVDASGTASTMENSLGKNVTELASRIGEPELTSENRLARKENVTEIVESVEQEVSSSAGVVLDVVQEPVIREAEGMDVDDITLTGPKEVSDVEKYHPDEMVDNNDGDIAELTAGVAAVERNEKKRLREVGEQQENTEKIPKAAKTISGDDSLQSDAFDFDEVLLPTETGVELAAQRTDDSSSSVSEDEKLDRKRPREESESLVKNTYKVSKILKTTSEGEDQEPKSLESGAKELTSMEPDEKDEKSSSMEKDENLPRRYKKRKIAMIVAYCGAGYQGMQRNPGAVTIEGELEAALFKAGAIAESNFGNPKKVDWMRAARTDKGVSAVGQVVSGNFFIDPPGFEERVNCHLPKQIRVLGYKRVIQSFNAKKLCDRRKYEYLMPVFAFDPTAHVDRESLLAANVANIADVIVGELSSDHGNLSAAPLQSGPGASETLSVTEVHKIETKSLGSELDELEIAEVPERSETVTEQRTDVSEDVRYVNVSVIEEDVIVAEVPTVGGKESTIEDEGYVFVSKLSETTVSCKEVEGTSAKIPGPEVVPSLGASEASQDTCKSYVSDGSTFKFGETAFVRLNRILAKYTGTHNFHNFTARTKADEPSAKRYILSFEAEKVITIEGMEFVRCTVVGQSFMLHQIRKMIGLAVAIMRGCAPESIIDTALRRDTKVNVPMAPELGLFLEECFYSAYNTKFRATHVEVSLYDFAKDVAEFKHNFIYPHIVATEAKAGVVALWLHSLNDRHFPDFVTARESEYLLKAA